MDEVPIRIEGYDISNIGPEHTVASMVVFEGGAPKKAHYRRFNIRGREGGRGPDDFASIEEVLSRRLSRFVAASDLSPHDAELDESFAALPSLIMIDGGKGQLSAGVSALQPLLERGVHRDLARQAARGGLRPGQLRGRCRSRPTPRPRACCSGSATRRTASRSRATDAVAARR